MFNAFTLTENRFHQIDKNGDGKLSAVEVQPYSDVSKILKNADADGDDMLSLEESRGPGWQQKLGQ